jgi:hypothetical protein
MAAGHIPMRRAATRDPSTSRRPARRETPASPPRVSSLAAFWRARRARAPPRIVLRLSRLFPVLERGPLAVVRAALALVRRSDARRRQRRAAGHATAPRLCRGLAVRAERAGDAALLRWALAGGVLHPPIKPAGDPAALEAACVRAARLARSRHRFGARAFFSQLLALDSPALSAFLAYARWDECAASVYTAAYRRGKHRVCAALARDRPELRFSAAHIAAATRVGDYAELGHIARTGPPEAAERARACIPGWAERGRAGRARARRRPQRRGSPR